jgi:hypothetical protein
MEVQSSWNASDCAVSLLNPVVSFDVAFLLQKHPFPHVNIHECCRAGVATVARGSLRAIGIRIYALSGVDALFI